MKRLFCSILTLLFVCCTTPYFAFAQENSVFITPSDTITLDGCAVPAYIYADAYQDTQFGTQYVYKNSDLFLPESTLQQNGFVITWDKKTRTLHIKPKENFTPKMSTNNKPKVPALQEAFRPVASSIKVYAGDKNIFPVTAYHNGKEMMISLLDLYHYFGTMKIENENNAIHFTKKSTIPAVIAPTGKIIALKDHFPASSFSYNTYYVGENQMSLCGYEVQQENQTSCLYLCLDEYLLKYGNITATIHADNMTLSATKPFTLPPLEMNLLQGPEGIHTVNCRLFNKNHKEIVSNDNYPVFLAMNTNLYIRADKLQEAIQ